MRMQPPPSPPRLRLLQCVMKSAVTTATQATTVRNSFSIQAFRLFQTIRRSSTSTSSSRRCCRSVTTAGVDGPPIQLSLRRRPSPFSHCRLLLEAPVVQKVRRSLPVSSNQQQQQQQLLTSSNAITIRALCSSSSSSSSSSVSATATIPSLLPQPACSSQQSQLRSMTYQDVIHLQQLLSSSSSTSSSTKSNTTMTTNDERNRRSLFLTSYQDTIPYCTDWTKQYQYRHHPNEVSTTTATDDDDNHNNNNNTRHPPHRQPIVCIVQPRTVQQISQIVNYCYMNAIPIIPLGGRTGLVGGTIPLLAQQQITQNNPACNPCNNNNNQNEHETDDDDNDDHRHRRPSLDTPLELLLSTKYLRDGCHQSDLTMSNNGILQCSVGYTLQEVHDFTKQQQQNSNNDHNNNNNNNNNTNSTNHSAGSWMVPIDIGSKGSCTMGGIVATNAGGQYYYRYASLLANVIGLQCVNGTGQIIQWNYNNNDDTTTNVGTNSTGSRQSTAATSHTTTTNTGVNLKDNTGYKLYPLLIGSEGTLGIITGVTMKCPPYLPNRQTMMVTIRPSIPNRAVPNNSTNEAMMKSILQIVQTAQSTFGEILAAVEWMDPNSINVVAGTVAKTSTTTTVTNDEEKMKKLQNLLSISSTSTSNTTEHRRDGNSHDHHNNSNNNKSSFLQYPHCILIETHGSNQQHDEEKCYDFLNTLVERNTSNVRSSISDHTINTINTDDDNDSDHAVPSFLLDVKMAKNETDAQYFWSIRESCNPSVTQLGYTYKYDVSIPQSFFHSLIQPIHDRIYSRYDTDRIIITNWGHVLDGNLHINITDIGSTQRDDEFVSIIEPYIYDQVLLLGGSISAEHGIGQSPTKRQYMNRVHDATTIQMMHAIKRIFDPAGILNPGKVLPPVLLPVVPY